MGRVYCNLAKHSTDNLTFTNLQWGLLLSITVSVYKQVFTHHPRRVVCAPWLPCCSTSEVVPSLSLTFFWLSRVMRETSLFMLVLLFSRGSFVECCVVCDWLLFPAMHPGWWPSTFSPYWERTKQHPQDEKPPSRSLRKKKTEEKSLPYG